MTSKLSYFCLIISIISEFHGGSHVAACRSINWLYRTVLSIQTPATTSYSPNSCGGEEPWINSNLLY